MLDDNRVEKKILEFVVSHRQTIWLFIFGLLCGIFVHGSFIANHMLNSDCMYNFHENGSFLVMGRWALTYLRRLFTAYDLPYVNTTLSIILISCTCIILIRIFEVEGMLIKGLFIGFIFCFPTITCTLSYSFLSDCYMTALLLSVLAVYCLIKGCKCSYGISILCIACSIGIYQNYFPVTLITLQAWILLKIIQGEKIEGIKIVRFLCIICAGFILYYFVLRAFLLFTQTNLSEQQGVSSLMNLSNIFGELGEKLRLCYHNFFDIFYGTPFDNKLVRVCLTVLAVISGITLTSQIIKNGIYKNVFESIIGILILTVGIPVGGVISTLISSDADLHMLTRMYWAILILLLPIISIKCSRHTWNVGINYALLIVLIVYFFNITQISYLNMYYVQEKQNFVYGKICYDMQNVSGSNSVDVPIVMVGCLSDSFFHRNIYTNDIQGMTGMNYSALLVKDETTIDNYFNYYYAIDLYFDYSKKMELADREEIVSMPSYPENGYMQMLDGVLVVKLSE